MADRVHRCLRWLAVGFLLGALLTLSWATRADEPNRQPLRFTSLDMECGMAIPETIRAAAHVGEVVLKWRFDATLPENWYGSAQWEPEDVPAGTPSRWVYTLKFTMKKPPRFDDICGLAKLGHELLHVMGARHP